MLKLQFINLNLKFKIILFLIFLYNWAAEIIQIAKFSRPTVVFFCPIKELEAEIVPGVGETPLNYDCKFIAALKKQLVLT